MDLSTCNSAAQNNGMANSKCSENCHQSLRSCLISASHWTHRCLNPNEVILDYLSTSKRLSHKAHLVLRKNEWTRHRYSTKSNRCVFTAYGLTLMPDAPIFAFIHGGLWQVKAVSAQMHEFMALPLAEHCVASVFVEYDLAPHCSLNDMIESIVQLLEYLEKFGRPIILAGHSAGAHLALMGLIRSRNVANIKQLHLISGLYDLSAVVGTNDSEALNFDDEIAMQLSPVHHVSSIVQSYQHVKILITVGGAESPLYKHQSRQMYERLRSYKHCHVEIAELPAYDHFTILFSMCDINHQAFEFLLRQQPM